MKKNFDSVGMMRDIRKKLSEKYASNLSLEQKELQQAKARFERHLAPKHARVAETGATYGEKA